jgi:cysteinyl-tRNA synthetase
LYDSATRELRDFIPREEGRASLYVCGLTVQSEPHIGHVRSGVNFDVLQRWLRHRGYEVTFIRNITDIDDKILTKAAEQGRPWYNLAYVMHRELDAAYSSLNVAPPLYEPAATGHVPEMIDLISELIGNGHAYVAADGSGDVYFAVRSWPTYGELSGQRVEDMEPARDSDPRGKRDPHDFALWKGWKKETEPLTAAWRSPWGPGRPGWHTECAAMAGKYLGPAFDIHGGGIDLRFPHHENEQAQARAVGRPFAAYWLHNAWITTEGAKMSKSLDNSLVVSDVLKRYRGIELRYYLLAAHYRSHVEFSFDALAEAAQAFERVERFLKRSPGVDAGEVPAAFADAMDNDLATPEAIAVLHDTVRAGHRADDPTPHLAAVRAMVGVLGLDPMDAAWPPSARDDARLTAAVDVLVRGLLEERTAARADMDWAHADAIRDRLTAAGVEVEDTPEGPSWAV